MLSAVNVPIFVIDGYPIAFLFDYIHVLCLLRFFMPRLLVELKVYSICDLFKIYFYQIFNLIILNLKSVFCYLSFLYFKGKCFYCTDFYCSPLFSSFVHLLVKNKTGGLRCKNTIIFIGKLTTSFHNLFLSFFVCYLDKFVLMIVFVYFSQHMRI